MKIVFMGTPDFAVGALEALVEAAMVIPFLPFGLRILLGRHPYFPFVEVFV